jgi:hypothetical protein
MPRRRPVPRGAAPDADSSPRGNAKREYPEAAAMLTKAMREQGLLPDESATSTQTPTSRPAPIAGAPAAPSQSGPKNLKVLPRTWTSQQVRALMQTFTESLGVWRSTASASPAWAISS